MQTRWLRLKGTVINGIREVCPCEITGVLGESDFLGNPQTPTYLFSLHTIPLTIAV